MMAIPQWRGLVDHIQSVPEGVYETNLPGTGYNNRTRFGKQFGEDGQSWCVMFDWDMYADVSLDHLVPKTDRVTAFSDWARVRGQWSEYPSIGAWVNLSQGRHTELVVGFDATHIRTKGGSTVAEDATDAGRGNGVYSHRTERRGSEVVGYFAPAFEDGCPPTADPDDPRGATAMESWLWPGTALPVEERTATASELVLGARNTSVRTVQSALAGEVGLDYAAAPGTFGPRTRAAVAAFQRKLGLTGSDADGVFGRYSLTELGRRQGFTVLGLDFFDGRHRPDEEAAAPGTPSARGHAAIPLDEVTFAHVTDASTTAAAKEACRLLGVPQTHWVPGILVAAKRESSYNFNAVNTWDSNAVGPRQSDGHPLNCSRGVLQVIPPTFAAYHHPGTPDAIYDGVANICAAMHYVMVRYGVYRDGSNLAGRVRQFDPTRRPGGY
ncbi:peptidoglycan-binding protein [Streptomyces sp. B3I8]|uniref:peptidoglycan-binding protein n=1 Tax=Streptomyces sp. B3I8 TaxID=3042303 RepID=UPI00277F76A6|nr:peptidoglycan-binding protein [Streptomyces sp. B3I8]MDQ0784780.1 peptidoglycan hydrolase-like protein with peptidoglycan-binding domain [Streptomyces sp. B3I8]